MKALAWVGSLLFAFAAGYHFGADAAEQGHPSRSASVEEGRGRVALVQSSRSTAGEDRSGIGSAGDCGGAEQTTEPEEAEAIDRVNWSRFLPTLARLNELRMRNAPTDLSQQHGVMKEFGELIGELGPLLEELGARDLKELFDHPRVQARLLAAAALGADGQDPTIRRRMTEYLESVAASEPRSDAEGGSLVSRAEIALSMYRAAASHVPSGRREQFERACHALYFYSSPEVRIPSRGSMAGSAQTALLMDGWVHHRGIELNPDARARLAPAFESWLREGRLLVERLSSSYGEDVRTAVRDPNKVLPSIERKTVEMRLALRAEMARLQALHEERIRRDLGLGPSALQEARGVDPRFIVANRESSD